jgi:hypothetical protein
VRTRAIHALGAGINAMSLDRGRIYRQPAREAVVLIEEEEPEHIKELEYV